MEDRLVAVAAEDRRVLAELINLFRASADPREFKEVPLPLILPLWSSGYALNGTGHVVGIKVGSPPYAQQVIDLIVQFRHLERLVFHSDDVNIPPAIAHLKSLKFVQLGGEIKRLPPELLDLDLEMQVAELGTGDVDSVTAAFHRAIEPISDAQNESPSLERSSPQVTNSDDRFTHYEDVIGSVWRTSFRRIQPALPELGVKWNRAIRAACQQSLRLNGLYLQLSRLEDPPLEIAAKGRDAIERYFADRRGGDLPLNEVKIVLVGHGSAGKTSLVKRVFGDAFDHNEPQTHGINIRSWTCATPTEASIKANFWDFGGQEIMHATHQFFLSKRSFYILLLDGRKEEDAEYWLQHIESFGGDSPVLVVLNKIDEHPSFELNRRFLKQKYPAIVDFCRISCATGIGIDEFKRRLQEEIGKVSILRTRWPARWFRVKQRLESHEASFISLADYNRICDEEGVVDLASRETLVDFLHDLGVILHFRDLHLLDTHVLDPLWVTEGVYRIINSEILAAQRGKLHLKQLSSILGRDAGGRRRFPREKHQYIIELMLKFELCYRLDAMSILIPDLLDIQEPPLPAFSQNSLNFLFVYSYLPRSVIPRFIVRMHRDISSQMLWRTGVVLEDSSLSASAVVRADDKARSISVAVTGKQKRDYFAVIRKVISDINLSFEKLTVTEIVPLPDAPGVTVDYRELVGHEQGGREEIFVGRLGRAYNVATLLNGIEDINSRWRSAQTVINVQGDYVAQQPVSDDRELLPRDAARRSDVAYEPREWERVITYATGVLFIGVVMYLVVRNTPFADPNLVVLIRTVLSLIVAVFGATIPGMLKVDLSARGLLIRAGGALALFVITFMLTPAVLPG